MSELAQLAVLMAVKAVKLAADIGKRTRKSRP